MSARRLDRWIFAGYPPSARGLGLFRIGFALYALLLLAPGVDFGLPAVLPAGLFAPPPGPMRLAPGVPPPVFFAALALALDVALVALLVGYRTRAASVATSVLLFVGYGFAFSFGKVIHNVLFLLLPLVMAAAGWGGAYSVDRRQGRGRRGVRAWPFAALALVVGFAMFTAGFPKVLGGWLDPATHATRGHFVNQFFAHGRQDLLGPFFLHLHSDVFWEFLDVLTVAMEVGFLAAVFYPRVFRTLLGVAVLFHLGTLLMLNISFAFNLAVYAAFLPWGRIERAVRPSLARVAVPRLPRSAWFAVGGLAALGVFASGALVERLDALVPFGSGLGIRDVVAAAFGAAVTAAAAAVVLRRFALDRRRAAPVPEVVRESS